MLTVDHPSVQWAVADLDALELATVERLTDRTNRCAYGGALCDQLELALVLDAASLTAENRMLLERNEAINEAMLAHKAEIERAKEEEARHKAQLELLRGRADLVKAVRGLKLEELHELNRTNSEVATSINALAGLIPALGHAADAAGDKS